MRIRQDADKTDWEFTFHHCAVDGIGAFLFITDLLVAYAHCCTGNAGPPPWRRLDPELLRNRDGHQLFNRRLKLVDLLRMARVSLTCSIIVGRPLLAITIRRVVRLGWKASCQTTRFII